MPQRKLRPCTARFASYIAVHLEIDIGGGLTRKLYDKRNYLNFPIVTFPFICSNIPAAPAYGVLSLSLSDIPELVSCDSYHDFLDIGTVVAYNKEATESMVPSG